MAKQKKKRAPQSPALRWKSEAKFPSGNSYWETRDGLFRVVRSEVFDGIPMPREWRLWIWKRSGWHRIAEGRSRASMEKIARARLAELESDDD